MEDIKPLVKITRTKLKQASLLWAEGFREVCCLHRAIVLCRGSRELLIRTGQCFLLNGFIFLGRYFGSIPCIFSFILSNPWYNDIAKHGFAAMGRSGPSVVESSKQK